MDKLFPYRIEFLVNKDIKDKLDQLLKSNPEYETISHVIRCAIIRLYNSEVK